MATEIAYDPDDVLRLVAFMDDYAKRLSEVIHSDLFVHGLENPIEYADKKATTLEEILRYALQDELPIFYLEALKFQLSESAGESYFHSIAAALSARKSAEARRRFSTKTKFFEWARTERARNPNLSKNALAAAYARENPGTSESTLRRYLSSPDESGVD